MNTKQPEVFETTLQKTNLWVKQISDALHWDDHQKAYHGLRAVLHALRDRLPVAEATHLGAQLPMLLRDFYYDEWKPGSTPIKIKTAQQFYEMKLLAMHLSPGEPEKLRNIFPPHLREIWVESEQTVDLSDYV